ncbi:hypothetical protein MKZ38_008356 [Zalerion maritima]|uniref:SGNH hydrolase-type esterase domain-containing protein n=1 Tax=Zalerion maritima TaxID=339359 RepID=A0AAD5RUA7_9PEZI|nr:hypothetical protein MKZ38_008356 [Zalerion maritima]
MKLSRSLSVLASFSLATALPGRGHHSNKPPAFFLAGDSTTAVQSEGGGGWGDGFLSFLIPTAWGTNCGHNGATTVSFVEGGDWATVIGEVEDNKDEYDCWVTIQFGHNDQKPAKNITLQMYQENLVELAEEVKSAGGTPVLVTPLTRRNFVSEHNATDSLHDERLATITAAEESHTTWIDLNKASLAYVNAIGEEAAHSYNLAEGDNTHLSDRGSAVFGRIVADLLLQKKGYELGKWIERNETMTALIRAGLPA